MTIEELLKKGGHLFYHGWELEYQRDWELYALEKPQWWVFEPTFTGKQLKFDTFDEAFKEIELK
jgi:hypothetical protein